MGKKLEDYTCDQLYNRLFHFLFCGKGKAFQQRVLMSIFFLHPCCWLLNVIGWSWHWIHVYLFFLMCYVKFVYSEAILINYPNSMKLEFLQGDPRFNSKFIYNLLWWRSCCLQNLDVVELTVTVLWYEFTIKRFTHSKSWSFLVVNDHWHILCNIYKLNYDIR